MEQVKDSCNIMQKKKKKKAELNLNATPNSAQEFHVEQELWLLDGSALFVWKWYNTFYILLQQAKEENGLSSTSILENNLPYTCFWESSRAFPA